MPPILFTLDRLHLNLNGTGGGRRGVPPHRGVMPLDVSKVTILGVTKDSTGAVLPSCTVTLFRTADDLLVEKTVSDGSGNYMFATVGVGSAYYVVAYKAGAPDVAGTTVNTIYGT